MDMVGSGAWYGRRAYANRIVNTMPTVALTAPTSEQVFTTGGPTLTPAWSYFQAQGMPQGQYRLTFWDDAGLVMYGDTGWLAGAAASKVVDLVALGVPTDSTDVSVRVHIRSAPGDFWEAESALVPFQIEWGIPTVTPVEEPDPVESTLTISAEWTYADTRGKPQTHYRVRLFTAEGVLLYTSGWIASAAEVHPIPTPLVEGGTYKVGIQVKNSEGVLS